MYIYICTFCLPAGLTGLRLGGLASGPSKIDSKSLLSACEMRKTCVRVNPRLTRYIYVYIYVYAHIYIDIDIDIYMSKIDSKSLLFACEMGRRPLAIDYRIVPGSFPTLLCQLECATLPWTLSQEA